MNRTVDACNDNRCCAAKSRKDDTRRCPHPRQDGMFCGKHRTGFNMWGGCCQAMCDGKRCTNTRLVGTGLCEVHLEYYRNDHSGVVMTDSTWESIGAKECQRRKRLGLPYLIPFAGSRPVTWKTTVLNFISDRGDNRDILNIARSYGLIHCPTVPVSTILASPDTWWSGREAQVLKCVENDPNLDTSGGLELLQCIECNREPAASILPDIVSLLDRRCDVYCAFIERLMEPDMLRRVYAVASPRLQECLTMRIDMSDISEENATRIHAWWRSTTENPEVLLTVVDNASGKGKMLSPAFRDLVEMQPIPFQWRLLGTMCLRTLKCNEEHACSLVQAVDQSDLINWISQPLWADPRKGQLNLLQVATCYLRDTLLPLLLQRLPRQDLINALELVTCSGRANDATTLMMFMCRYAPSVANQVLIQLDRDATERLVGQQSAKGKTCLHFMIKYGSPDNIRQILACIPDQLLMYQRLNCRTGYSSCYLDYALKQDQTWPRSGPISTIVFNRVQAMERDALYRLLQMQLAEPSALMCDTWVLDILDRFADDPELQISLLATPRIVHLDRYVSWIHYRCSIDDGTNVPFMRRILHRPDAPVIMNRLIRSKVLPGLLSMDRESSAASSLLLAVLAPDVSPATQVILRQCLTCLVDELRIRYADRFGKHPGIKDYVVMKSVARPRPSFIRGQMVRAIMSSTSYLRKPMFETQYDFRTVIGMLARRMGVVVGMARQTGQQRLPDKPREPAGVEPESLDRLGRQHGRPDMLPMIIIPTPVMCNIARFCWKPPLPRTWLIC